MNEAPPQHVEETQLSWQRSALRQWVSVLLLVYLLILAVGFIGAGFKSVAGERAQELFAFATNPFLGLLVGIMATALIQSSSTVTSIIVGLVAGGMPVVIAVPMVMGANVGTTITNTLVSLGHVAEKREFRRAFAAATVHDFFNLLNIVIFLPLEILFHPLERLGLFIGNLLVGGGSYEHAHLNFVSGATKPLINLFEEWTHVLPHPFDGLLTIIVGVILIFIAITLISKLLKALMVGRAREIVHLAIGRGPLAGIAAGTAITVLVQSSSTTTSLIVPLAGAGVFRLAQVYPFTLGANIGTTVTALLAATAVSGAEALPALQIALVHFFYNLFGVVVIYGIPWLARIPLLGAENLAAIASERKPLAFAYVVGVFFLIPATFLGITTLY